MGQPTSDRAGGHVERAGRCAAAHVEDGRGCDGPADAVRIVDVRGGEAAGCVRHGAALLASLDGGRVYPGSVDSAAIEVFNAARTLQPFEFMRRQPEQQQEQLLWPPVEQEDTDDSLHERPWLPPASAAESGLSDVPGVGWSGSASTRECADLSGAPDGVVVREALREAVGAGLISPAEAVEAWPVDDRFGRAAEHDDGAGAHDVPAPGGEPSLPERVVAAEAEGGSGAGGRWLAGEIGRQVDRWVAGHVGRVDSRDDCDGW